jgi:hypothetical protein
MKPITEELIHQSFDCFERTQIEKTDDGWLLTTPTGRTVKIHDYHIDFRGITKIMPGEVEKDKQLGDFELTREQLQFELMSLAFEATGVVSLISCKEKQDRAEGGLLWLYAKCYKLPVEGPWVRVGSIPVKRRFGHEATIRLVWGGYRISVGKGMSAVISLNPERELMVTKAIGGGAVLEAAMLLVNDLQGYVIAGGSKDNILFSLAFGETTGIEVIPELYISDGQHFRTSVAIGAAMGLPIMFLAISMGNSFEGLAIGYGVAIAIRLLYMFLFQKNGKRHAQERGQALKGNHPSAGIGRRQSNIEAARKRSML